MKRSKRIEVLDQRPVNKDGFIDEWPEMGFVSMHSPYDPKPSVKIEDGIITELDGKKRDEFDFLDQFIADYAIRADRAEASMAIPSLEIARKIVDIHVSRKEILEIVSGITPAKMVAGARQEQYPLCARGLHPRRRSSSRCDTECIRRAGRHAQAHERGDDGNSPRHSAAHDSDGQHDPVISGGGRHCQTRIFLCCRCVGVRRQQAQGQRKSEHHGRCDEHPGLHR